MKKTILKFGLITAIAATSFISCERNRANTDATTTNPAVEGLNAQPQQEVAPATPVTPPISDSTSNQVTPSVQGTVTTPEPASNTVR